MMRWDILAVIGFLGWVIAVPGFIFGALGGTDRPLAKTGVIWGGLFFVCYALWILGLLRFR